MRLPAEARLKQSREFAELRTKGQRVVCGCLILNWLERGSQSRRRLGVVVSRKVGSAVIRSRARRVLRESWRRNQHRLRRGLEVVLVARPSITHVGQPRVEHDFLLGARRAGLLHDHEHGATTGTA